MMEDRNTEEYGTTGYANRSESFGSDDETRGGSRAAESVAEAGRAAAGQASDGGTMTQVKDKASEVASQATEKVEQARETTAEQMASTADTVRENVQGKGGIQEKAGVAAADGMEKTAQYLRDHDTQAMMQDVEKFVREHPTQAVLGAVAAGFIIGRILR
jgi:ElaB/YqjD/DUF883 family membrane-anchored ribosome-binding protein